MTPDDIDHGALSEQADNLDMDRQQIREASEKQGAASPRSDAPIPREMYCQDCLEPMTLCRCML